MTRWDLFRARQHHRAIGRIDRKRGIRLTDEKYLHHARAWNAIRAKHPGYLFSTFTDRAQSHRAMKLGPHPRVSTSPNTKERSE